MIVVNNYFEVSSLFPQINHGENKLLLIDDDNDHRGTFESVGGLVSIESCPHLSVHLKSLSPLRFT